MVSMLTCYAYAHATPSLGFYYITVSLLNRGVNHKFRKLFFENRNKKVESNYLKLYNKQLNAEQTIPHSKCIEH